MDILDPGYVSRIESLLEGLHKAYEQGRFNKDPDTNLSDYKRAKRMILSQGNDLFAGEIMGVPDGWLADPDIAMERWGPISSILESEQRGMNYGKGVEGHHPLSVSSTEAATAHLKTVRDRLEFAKILNDDYQVGGTNGWGQVGLTKTGHQGPGRGVAKEFNAHVTSDPLALATSDGFPIDQGTWQKEDFTSFTNPRELADEFMNRSGFPQLMFADTAYDQPAEVLARQTGANLSGLKVRNLDGVGVNDKGKSLANINRDASRANYEHIRIGQTRYPQLVDEGLVPNVDIATNIGARVPRALGKPTDDVRRAAGMYVRSAGKTPFPGTPTPQVAPVTPKPPTISAARSASLNKTSQSYIPDTAARKPGTLSIKDQLAAKAAAASTDQTMAITRLPSQIATKARKAKVAAGVAKPARALAIGAALPGAVGAVFDGAALASGANELRSKDPRTQLAGGLDAVSGATGLVALAPTPASVPLGIASAGSGLLSTAVRNKVDQKVIKAAPKVATTVHKTNNALQPVSNAITKGLQIGGNWLLQKMGIGK